MRSVITELDEGRSYVDSTTFGDLTLLFRHTLTALIGGGARVTYRVEIRGPDSDRVGLELGPQLSGDFPVTIAQLFAAARPLHA